MLGYYLAVGKKLKKSKKNIIAEQRAGKEENLAILRQRIRSGKQKTITNDEVEKLLSISDATAERYLDELEREGILRQEGRTGRFVRYKVL